VAGAIGVGNNDCLAARATTYLCFSGRLEGTVAGPATRSLSYGLSFTRDLLDRAGPFDECMRTNEDTLMARRLVELGVTPWFDPSVCIEHHGPVGLVHMWREQRARGRLRCQGELILWPRSARLLRLESKASSAVALVALRTAHQFWIRSRWIARDLGHSADRRDLLATLPWMCLGMVANQIGWAEGQLEFSCDLPSVNETSQRSPEGPLVRRVATSGQKVVALTLDDGPGESTAQVLEILTHYGIKANFFLIGEEAEARPDMVRSIAAAGHTVGIHGWSHRSFTDLGFDGLLEEIERTKDLLQILTEGPCRHVRPPFGDYDARAIDQLSNLDLLTWLWTVEARDWDPSATATQIARDILCGLTPGGVILLHDGGGDRSSTVAALPTIIEGVLARRFRFVKLEEVVSEPSDVSQTVPATHRESTEFISPISDRIKALAT